MAEAQRLLQPPERLRTRRLRQLGWAGVRNAVGLGRLLMTDRGRPLPELAALQLRLAFQGLGPTFVKLGQLVSSSPGTFPQVLVEEFAHCQDSVPPEPWEVVSRVLEEDLGDLRAHFSWIDWNPIAAGSIAQVYPAELADGTRVVLKVQRSNLVDVLREDLHMLLRGARVAVKVVPSLAAANPVGVIEDFAQGLVEELSFTVEAAHMEALRKVLADWPVRIPRVYTAMTTDRVLTMERLDGVKISDLGALNRLAVDRQALADTILGSLLYSALRHGVFHGDGHAGNMLVLGDGTLGMLDFGIVGRLDPDTRIKVSRLLAALVDRRFDVMAVQIMELADMTNADLAAATADLTAIAGEHLGRPLEQIPLARLLADLLRAANRHGVVLPGDLILLMKQILYLDGLGRTLNPGFDVFADGARFTDFLAPEVVAERSGGSSETAGAP